MKKSNLQEIKEFLDLKVQEYNVTSFIRTDPVQIPHQYEREEDIEISAFLTATISWGQKGTIIANAQKLLSRMPGGPHEFILSVTDQELTRLLPFVHRTFNGYDCVYFMRSLRHIYRKKGGLRNLFENTYLETGDLRSSLVHFRKVFFEIGDPGRTGKHVANILENASAKRLNMFLRWMVRRDTRGVDFGIWEKIPMHALYMPLDVHSGSVARKLGLLKRKQNDWKAVEELTAVLRNFDREDPVRYDYALYGLGAFEKF